MACFIPSMSRAWPFSSSITHHMTQTDPDHRFKNFALITQWILRTCAPNLTANQVVVLLYVADRTHGWGKPSEIITYRHFLKGIPSNESNGEPYAGALPFTAPTLTNALHRLREVGLLQAVTKRKLISYQINLDWNPSLALEEPMPLRSPKRLKEMHSLQTSDREEVAPITKESLQIITKESLVRSPKNFAIKKSKEKKGKPKKPETTSLVPAALVAEHEESLEERLACASSRNATSRRKRLLRWNTASAEIAWFDALSRFYPDADAITVKKFNVFSLRDYGKKWMAAGQNRNVLAWLDYLEWCMSHWSIIREETFGWMKDAPAVPCIGFLVKLGQNFEQAYEAKESIEAMQRMTARERQIAKRVRSGMAHDVAEKEVDDRLGLSQERERIEAAARELKTQNIARTNGERERRQSAIRNEDWKLRRAAAKPAERGTFDEWV